ncbi:hypothetical protein ABZ137_40095 [Streptomyces bobili]|uniref:hypothetical protein n=1 Tax=Streptomyces bobili TaxID=67280 RepID=UPI0033A9163A
MAAVGPAEVSFGGDDPAYGSAGHNALLAADPATRAVELPLVRGHLETGVLRFQRK